jgi:3-methyladenine DNA glycosylase AlkC
MAERLKDLYFTGESVRAFADVVKKHHPDFDDVEFVRLLTEDAFHQLEFKAMSRRATECLARLLPASYRAAVEILSRVAPEAKGMEAFCLPTFVELYGLEDWDTSLPAMALFTKYASCEFAVRPFILQDPDRAMAFLEGLTDNENENVRRFASEGCRPRLPWAVSLPPFKKDPRPILPILERLKDDESDFVRRSVANNLNDISKDHPDLVLEVCARWKGSSEGADWIVKHACRTLLKKGDSRALRLFGFGDPSALDVQGVTVTPPRISIGEEARLSFTLRVGTEEPSEVRLEYVVRYVKANGRTSPKVFQIREATLPPGEHEFTKTISFADLSTRKHHPGSHGITVVVNGVEKADTAVLLDRGGHGGE